MVPGRCLERNAACAPPGGGCPARAGENSQTSPSLGFASFRRVDALAAALAPTGIDAPRCAAWLSPGSFCHQATVFQSSAFSPAPLQNRWQQLASTGYSRWRACLAPCGPAGANLRGGAGTENAVRLVPLEPLSVFWMLDRRPSRLPRTISDAAGR